MDTKLFKKPNKMSVSNDWMKRERRKERWMFT